MGDVITVEALVGKYHEALACTACRSERWYANRHRFIRRLAVENGRDPEVAYVVYALLSWNQSDAENVRLFRLWATTGKVYGTAAMLRRIRLAEDGDLVGALRFRNGEKLKTFADNLAHPWAFRGVTVDRHSGDVVTGSRRRTKALLGRVRGSGYAVMASVYIAAALRIGVTPQRVQEVTWIHHVTCGNGMSEEADNG